MKANYFSKVVLAVHLAGVQAPVMRGCLPVSGGKTLLLYCGGFCQFCQVGAGGRTVMPSLFTQFLKAIKKNLKNKNPPLIEGLNTRWCASVAGTLSQPDGSTEPNVAYLTSAGTE